MLSHAPLRSSSVLELDCLRYEVGLEGMREVVEIINEDDDTVAVWQTASWKHSRADILPCCRSSDPEASSCLIYGDCDRHGGVQQACPSGRAGTRVVRDRRTFWRDLIDRLGRGNFRVDDRAGVSGDLLHRER